MRDFIETGQQVAPNKNTCGKILLITGNMNTGQPTINSGRILATTGAAGIIADNK